MAASQQPPDHLLPILMAIESSVLAIYEQHPQLQDKVVETTYDQLKNFYQKLARGKEEYEPSSMISSRQALIDAILKALDTRAEEGFDDALIQNANIQPGGRPIPNVESLYASGFTYLIRSARFWRKERGPRGYLKYIKEMLPD